MVYADYFCALCRIFNLYVSFLFLYFVSKLKNMGKKKEKPINLNELEEEEKMKYEIAEELGLLDRVLAQGWKSLTSKETGRIGGLVTKRRRTQENGTAQT